MYSDKELLVIKELLFKIADDQLIIGHRNSEWTGLGPILEEDIAFSSIAQDKIGQACAVYNILHELGEKEPDTLGFMKNAKDFKCCHLVEYPIGEYDFSLMRNFLFNHAENIRFEMLASSSFEPLAKLAKKIKGEIKYHVMHADTWVKHLGNANEESRERMQNSLSNAFNLALGIFEPGVFEKELVKMKIFSGEIILQGKWLKDISSILEKTLLKLPTPDTWSPSYGGRNGSHTEHLQMLIEEMGEVFRVEPNAEW